MNDNNNPVEGDNNNQGWVVPPPNNNNEMELEEEEEEEDEEDEDDSEDDDEEDEDDDVPAVPDALGLQNMSIFDGGIADDDVDDEGNPKVRGKATEADITLYFVCSEEIISDHPILKGGTVVQVGMKKQSFLSVVFARYCNFCKEKSPVEIAPSDLEFVHAMILNGDDNAEGAALMKNDRITVRREQEDDRCVSAKHAREIRESERHYFQQLGNMRQQGEMDDSADVMLNCQGLNGLVSCHSFMIRNRCPWLYNMIEDARKLDAGRQSVLTLPTEEDERILELPTYRPVKVEELSSAAHIESDEDDHIETSNNDQVNANKKVWVSLPYSAEAVRILLEYCYTNRVVSLGMEAFSKACKKHCIYKKYDGPVPPITLRQHKWPNGGAPLVSMQTALEAVKLAHMAGFPRLALMCEVAASHHVSFDNVIDALVACESIESAYGSPLVNLRKIAMRLVIQTDYDLDGGVGDFLEYALKEKGALLVPTLLAGTNELLEASIEEQRSKNSSQSPISVSARSITPRGKRDWRSAVYANMDKFDRADALERTKERKKRRKIKHDDDATMDDDSWSVPADALVEKRLQKIWQHAKNVGRGLRPVARKVAPRKSIKDVCRRRGGL